MKKYIVELTAFTYIISFTLGLVGYLQTNEFDFKILNREQEERVEKLEEENVGMTNELYELQNRQDILQDPRYGHLNEFSLGE